MKCLCWCELQDVPGILYTIFFCCGRLAVYRLSASGRTANTSSKMKLVSTARCEGSRMLYTLQHYFALKDWQSPCNFQSVSWSEHQEVMEWVLCTVHFKCYCERWALHCKWLASEKSITLSHVTGVGKSCWWYACIFTFEGLIVIAAVQEICQISSVQGGNGYECISGGEHQVHCAAED